MLGPNYPSDWDSRRRRVLDQHMNRCVNCRLGESPLEVHHIVPVEHGGSHRNSNLVPLCPQCHEAAHGNCMGPRIRWYTNGKLSTTEFNWHLSLWKQMRGQFGVPRYDPDDEAIYIPLADVERVLDSINN